MVKLCSLLAKHSRHCSVYECECKQLLKSTAAGAEDVVIKNFFIFTSLQELPDSIKNSWKTKAMSILTNDIFAKFKCDDVALLMAEINFLYFGNYYHALVLISNAECKDPPLLMRLQLYNIRELISSSMKEIDDSALRVLDSLAYRTQYLRFLRSADDIAELTTKFWATLLNDSPDTFIINSIGLSLFGARKSLVDAVGRIKRICPNNPEFLAEYGLFMRLIVHDVYAASSAFNAIARSIERLRWEQSEEQSFSILRSGASNMMVVISLEARDFMKIVDANARAGEMIGCTRKDLIGKSIVNIMPPTVARGHQDWMQKYFRDMVAKSLNRKRFFFLKGSENLYVPCAVMKTIVPSLAGGFRGVMFAHADKAIAHYTGAKKEVTDKRVSLLMQSNRSEPYCATRAGRSSDSLPTPSASCSSTSGL